MHFDSQSETAGLVEVIKLIEDNDLRSALQRMEQFHHSPFYHGYKGLILYLQQNYAAAAEELQIAVSENNNSNWHELLKQAKTNAAANIQDFVPEVEYFTKESLQNLYQSESDFEWPPRSEYHKTTSKLQNINNLIGTSAGIIGSILLDGITEIWGRLFGYRDKIWTNWYRKSVFSGVLSLAYMRNVLSRKNLFSTYSNQEKSELNSSLSNYSEGVQRFRTINGTFNNLENPIEGAAGTRFQRNVNVESSNSLNTNHLMSPNPRLLSRKLLTREQEMKEAPFVNMLTAAWIQFQNHDWISHGEPLMKDVHTIQIDKEDPIYLKYHQSKMFVGKTPLDPTQTATTPYHYTFINEVTHWWDGSQIYGSDLVTAQSLRSFIGGNLTLTSDQHLPLDNKGIETTGFKRNWWVGLAMFHTLFAREHNTICDHLQDHYPDWEDEQLYQVARLINSALMAKIHTLEWNSAINPNQMIYNGNHSNWYGFLTTLLRSKKNWRTVADINIRNTELGGVVGNPIEHHNADFGLTQEFVEAYRIHSMLPETLKIKSIDSKEDLEEIHFVKTRQAGSVKCVHKYGLANLWYSLGNQHPGQVILNNYPKFMQELSIPGNPVYDMGAVDILRSRERGVPRYNEFRRQLQLTPIKRFEDLTSDQEVLKILKELYGSGSEAVEQLDFMIGTLAEEHRPTGFAFGETMFQLFLLNATRRLQADRFFTDDYRPEIYTKEGMEWVDNNTLKSVLLRHYPVLQNTGLANVLNAFEPWDEKEKLEPERHPLRAYDKELKKNPWIGDAYKNQT